MYPCKLEDYKRSSSSSLTSETASDKLFGCLFAILCAKTSIFLFNSKSSYCRTSSFIAPFRNASSFSNTPCLIRFSTLCAKNSSTFAFNQKRFAYCFHCVILWLSKLSNPFAPTSQNASSGNTPAAALKSPLLNNTAPTESKYRWSNRLQLP